MLTNNITLRNCAGQTKEELHKALDAAIGYDDWLNSIRSDKDKPVIYGKYRVHESAKGTVIVNKIS